LNPWEDETFSVNHAAADRAEDPRVRITSMRLNAGKHFGGQSRAQIVACFDCEVLGISMRGCVLLEQRNGFEIRPPKTEMLGGRPALEFASRSLSNAVLLAAKRKFREMRREVRGEGVG
jgi:hypothetical protein